LQLRATRRSCGTRSGSDLVLPVVRPVEAPSRYHSLYCIGRIHLQTAKRTWSEKMLDLGYGLRWPVKHKSYSALVTLILALGIGGDGNYQRG
jgi:hypothetical protein